MIARGPGPLGDVGLSKPVPTRLTHSIVRRALHSTVLSKHVPYNSTLHRRSLTSLFNIDHVPIHRTLQRLRTRTLLGIVTRGNTMITPLIRNSTTRACRLHVLLRSRTLHHSVPLLAGTSVRLTTNCVRRVRARRSCDRVNQLGHLFRVALCGGTPGQQLLHLVRSNLGRRRHFLHFGLRGVNLNGLSRRSRHRLLETIRSHSVRHSIGLLAQRLGHNIRIVTNFLRDPTTTGDGGVWRGLSVHPPDATGELNNTYLSASHQIF